MMINDDDEGDDDDGDDDEDDGGDDDVHRPVILSFLHIMIEVENNTFH